MEKENNLKSRLKFRAWHTKLKKMFLVWSYSPDFIFEDTLDGVDLSENGTTPAKTEDCILMQCTGMHMRKNDLDDFSEMVGIWEGDIIEFMAEGNLIKGVVTYSDGCFWVQTGQNKYNETLTELIDTGNYTIYGHLGNIYENPYLARAFFKNLNVFNEA